MKLFTKYNRVNLIATLLIIVFTALIYYWAISYILNTQVDKDILKESQEISFIVQRNNKLPGRADFKYQHTAFYPVNAPIKPHFIDTSLYDSRENDYDIARGLVTSININKQNFKVVIIQSKVETEDLIAIIFKITISIIVILMLTVYISNRFILRQLWQPFYKVLAQLKAFSLDGPAEVTDQGSDINEFRELNEAAMAMAARVKTDYQHLKSFTENASHEMLTPIAVLNSKLDSFIQSGEYTSAQSKLLTDVYGALSRLTRINQSLLLLVKIENRLMKDEQSVDLKPLLIEKTDQFRDLFHERELQVITDLHDKNLYISRYLLEVLLNNLLSNAMRHNYPKGCIKVTAGPDELIVQNTGAATPLPPAELFKRFNKSSTSEGTGLGLAISKQICDNYGYTISYRFDAPYHTFTVKF